MPLKLLLMRGLAFCDRMPYNLLDMKINKIGIIGGTNGLGATFAAFFEKEFGKTKEIMVSGRNTKITNKKIVQECDLVIFSVPISATQSVIDSLIEDSREVQIWMDFTSVKVGPVKSLLHSNSQVCGAHPLFGPLLDISGQKIVLCPERISDSGLKSLKEVFGSFELLETTGKHHDKLMGIIQCVSHFSDFVLGKTLKDLEVDMDELLQYASPPYRIKLELLARIFAQNPELYADISFQNKSGLLLQNQFIKSAESLGVILNDGKQVDLVSELKTIQAFLGTDFCMDSFAASQKLLNFEGAQETFQKITKTADEFVLKSSEIAIFGENLSHTDEASWLFKERQKKTSVCYFKHIFEVVEAVEAGLSEYGILPYENSTKGSVFETLEALFEHESVQIIDLKEKGISQNLLALPGTKIDQVMEIHSHPQALAQSQKFLIKHCTQASLINALSTAIAAKKVKNQLDGRIAAIGSRALAEGVGLEVLASDMEEFENKTRFILISKKEKKSKPFHFLSFVVWFEADKSGNLANLLTFLADKNINLIKLDSRRASKEYGNYLFFLDAEMDQEIFANIESDLQCLVGGMKVLGQF